ncbi:hypothetical protein M378DRAFT_360143 [Amanita muscaria Koide BX008]|uniref:Uncharacterized protein n=1 Tax=Amanita muscaria (strain Koide BX008) TaxID=946122 RepID=A0A0C2WNL9_AMAMK|nr:hypothetical protein M378DRAFT_360143 [Amanita muscaria Koide BX008]
MVVGSQLKVWPTVTAQRKITYIDLKSSLIIARGQVDADVLAVLAKLGLICVQLPQRFLDLLDDSMIRLSPSVAHRRLRVCPLFTFSGLSSSSLLGSGSVRSARPIVC